MVHKQGIYLLK